MSVLTQSLLSEKNSEIDELTAEVERLSTELEQMRASKTQQLHGAPSSAEVILSSLTRFSLFGSSYVVFSCFCNLNMTQMLQSYHTLMHLIAL